MLHSLITCSHDRRVCQSRLQACLQERAELLQAQEGLVRKQEREEERSVSRARVAWETERRELKRTMARLQDELHRSQDSVVEMELRQKVGRGGEVTPFPSAALCILANFTNMIYYFGN